MSEADIQRFLTSKNSCPNTNYNYYQSLSASGKYTWHWANGHFVCLSEERFGDGEVIGSGDTAAHIIWQAAQDYRINPQVLIVLLQKETSLITDPIPNNGDYRKATGYGCPDTAPCSAQYYGFKNQIRKAASLFRTVLDGGWTNYPLGNNYVQYNPNAACGGSVVNIRSLATSALYRYTPYQPNAGALAAGYGTVYCGAYGNRNFYLYFEDWFGGIVESRAEWQDMQLPRVMSVDKTTLLINADDRVTTDVWLEQEENYYFTRKTTVFWGGEQQVCLQRKIDEGTNRCVLMDRLSDIVIDAKAIILPKAKDYEVEKWTCIVNLKNKSVECGKKAYSVGEVLNIKKIITIDKEVYLVVDGDYGILKARVEPKLYYQKIGPTLMKLKNNSHKYKGEEYQIVQDLEAKEDTFISITDKTIIEDKVFYRTTHDHDYGNNYIIPASDLSDSIFTQFLYPRNLELINSTSSINLDNGQVCHYYNEKVINRYTKKIRYNAEVYFQNEDEVNTNCVVKASELRETEYNFNENTPTSGFMSFQFPRNLKTKSDVYMINIKNGKTCNEFLRKNNTQKYNSKIMVNNIVFYRAEYNTGINSSCAVPANVLQEVN